MAEDALRSVLARFGVEVDTSGLDGADKKVDGFIGQLRQLGAVLAGGALVQGIRSFVQSTADAFDEINDSSERLQISTQTLQEWRYAAKLSGAEAGAFEAGIGAFTRALRGVDEGAKGPIQALKKLGINAKDSKGEIGTFEDLLPGIADGLAKLPNDTERAGVAMKLFGKAGLQLLPLLSKGSAGIEELKKEFKELGGGAGDEALASAAEYNDELDRMDVTMTALKGEILHAVLPAFQWLAEAGRKVSRFFTTLARDTHLLDIALIASGGVLAVWAVKALISLAPVLGPIIAIGAGIATIALALDDLWTTFEGGSSVTQEFVDSMYGVGTTAEIVDGLISLWDDLVTSILEAGQAAKEYLGFGKAEKVENRGQKRAREKQETQAEAVKNGDLAAYTKSRQAAGRTTPAGIRTEFLNARRGLIASGAVKANENDVAAGIADKKGRALAESNLQIGGLAPGVRPLLPSDRRADRITAPSGGGKTVVVQSSNPVNIHLPPGSDRAQAERMRKIAKDVWSAEERAAHAALGTKGT